MPDAPRFAYAAARMQSRYGQRPAASTWSHLARIGDFAHLLQSVRATALAPWVSGFGADTGVHAIEGGLREAYRTEVAEVARWVPLDWHAATAWFAWVPDLAALAHLRRRRPAHDWMADDPVMRVLGGHQRADSAGLSDFATLLDAPDDRGTVAELWLESWHGRWPRAMRRHRRAAVERVRRRVRGLLGLDGAATDDRAGVEHDLRRAFRRHTREPAGALAYLALLYIQYRHLRGLLLQPRLFPG